MKIRNLLLITACLVAISGCYATITVTVIDAETGQPIEGAVVLAEWWVTKGMIGMTYSKSQEVVEAVTDKEGKSTIAGVFDPSVMSPDVTVYKKGYVAWNNRRIFPSNQRRLDFKWQDGYVFKLEKFKPEYSYDKHTYFIHNAILSGTADEKKKLMQKAYGWEEQKSAEERGKTFKERKKAYEERVTPRTEKK